MNIFYVIVILSIFASSCSQLLLKKSADREYKTWLESMFNWRVLLAYSIFFSSLIINIFALSHGVMLKDMPALESLSAIFIPIISFVFLKETITIKKILASVLVLIGIIVFYL